MDKFLWLNKLLWLIAAVLACIVIIGVAGLMADTRTSDVQTGAAPTTFVTNPAVPTLQQNINPTTIPVKTAYNRTLALYWEFALEGPYPGNPNWSAAVLDPEPVTLFDNNGSPGITNFTCVTGTESPATSGLRQTSAWEAAFSGSMKARRTRTMPGSHARQKMS